ncbi:MAG: hypothetical protein MI673_07365 [Thiotrichales bacterium]|nr:hypothetical protein [Thiotrichales bacterium]
MKNRLCVFILPLCMVACGDAADTGASGTAEQVQAGGKSAVSSATGGQAAAAQAPEIAAEDLEYEEKTATYKKLEKARRDLDRRLARIKMSLWNVKLPKDEADVITEQLMQAYKLINKPKLMGAFRSKDEMLQELTRVKYAKDKVNELKLQIEAKKSNEG